MARALITNDDGVESVGLGVLARAAAKAGLDVIVAAPTWDSSGASASLTAVEEDGRFLVEARPPDGAADARWFAVEAAPAFIVRAGVEGAFGDPPDVVLSGINLGQNTGAAVLHSGTVGAVLTAATQGFRGMAVSLAHRDPLHWDTAGRLAEGVIPALLDRPPGTVLNLNVPSVPLAELRGIRRGRLSSRGTVHTTVTELGKGYVKLAYTQPDEELEPGTDAALLAEGYASLTPLVAPCEAEKIDTEAILEHAQAVL
jgi:5'-nucleotidase